MYGGLRTADNNSNNYRNNILKDGNLHFIAAKKTNG
jgi:hypothetical protein